MIKEQEMLEKELKENFEKDIDTIRNHITSLRLIGVGLSNTLNEKDEEIERLNNIINGMEKFFQYAYDNEIRPLNDRKVSVWTICLDKLQELKGSSDNG